MLLALATIVVVVPCWLSSRPGPGLAVDDHDSSGVGGESGEIGVAAIDVATAPWYEWTLLEGIGAARARRIVEYRRHLGGFDSLDDLRDVPGLPRGWIERARPYLRLPQTDELEAPRCCR